LLQELFTRDGIGILLTAGGYETTRIARIEDIGGILELLQPLEQQSILVRRSREILEMDIEKFILMERDGTVIACAALYPYLMESMAELACFAVHLEYQRGGRGTNLLKYMEQQAIKLQMQQLFVLTTQTAHWFLERGFVETTLDSLPMHKQTLYNYNRNSKVFIKQLQ
jgi:amino-acid N-acetyltransferase